MRPSLSNTGVLVSARQAPVLLLKRWVACPDRGVPSSEICWAAYGRSWSSERNSRRERYYRGLRGEIGAIVITESFAGTDAAAIETTARPEDDVYVIRGKKRFIVSAGVARPHMIYARTSNDPEAIRSYRHLTAFIVEKGTPGFTVEKVNEIMGFRNIQNGVLDFNNVRVPAANRIGNEGDGAGA